MRPERISLLSLKMRNQLCHFHKCQGRCWELLLSSVGQQAGGVLSALCVVPDAGGRPAADLLSLSVHLPFLSPLFLSFPLYLPSSPFMLSSVSFKLPFLQVAGLASHPFKRWPDRPRDRSSSGIFVSLPFRGSCSGLVKEVEGEENNSGPRAESLGEAKLIRGAFSLAPTPLSCNSRVWRSRSGLSISVICSALLRISYSRVSTSVSALPLL